MEKIINSATVETLYQDKFTGMRCRQNAAKRCQQGFIDILVQQKNTLGTTEYYPVANIFFKHMNN
jgi:hypothetical protein